MGYGKDYLRNKHQDTLKQIFSKPTSTSVKWQDVETLILALGGEVSNGNGSRVRFLLKGSIHVFTAPTHRLTLTKVPSSIYENGLKVLE